MFRYAELLSKSMECLRCQRSSETVSILLRLAKSVRHEESTLQCSYHREMRRVTKSARPAPITAPIMIEGIER